MSLKALLTMGLRTEMQITREFGKNQIQPCSVSLKCFDAMVYGVQVTLPLC
jgi:hypothetical protein